MAWYETADCDLEAFRALCLRATAAKDVPSAIDVVRNVPIYDGPRCVATLETDRGSARGLLAEWAHVLGQGPGALVIKGAVTGVDPATDVFHQIIAEEKAGAAGGGDHFAAAGSNDRVWNAHQKLCLAAPEVFARYMASPAIAAVCEAWLGPGYQVTAQVNLVHPGGAAQSAHRDYHLGFMTAEGAASIPAHMHGLSPMLTLQGAVAHCDMPIESGPTKLLPFSQTFGPGYLAFHLPEFRDFFEAHHVQLPLAKGDALFFSPALFHAAGENKTSDISRMANLLQVSSGLGRAMEALDRDAMCRAVFPHLGAYGGLERERHHRGHRRGVFLPHQSRPRPAHRRACAENAGADPRRGQFCRRIGV